METKSTNPTGHEADISKLAPKRCPATDGLPITMLQGSWERTCRAKRKSELTSCWNGEKKIQSPCAACQGKKIPPEVTIKTMDQMNAPILPASVPVKNTKESDKMAPPKKNGTCQSCGDKNLQVGKNWGILMCASCNSIHAHVRNRPKACIDAWKRVNNDGELGGSLETVHIAVDEKTEAVMKRIAAAVGCEGEDAEGLAAYIETSVFEQVGIERRRGDDLQENYDELLSAYETYRVGNDTSSIKKALGLSEKCAPAEIVASITEMTKVIDRYREKCEELIEKLAICDQVDEIAVEQFLSVPPMTNKTIFFNLALDVIRGKVTGLDADRIEEMAGVVA